MERFTILLGGTLSFMVLFTAVSFAGHQSKLATQASVQSVITTEFAYSLTQQAGSVLGVYGDENREDVMVLFQMNDPAGLSAEASNYEVFVTTADGELEVQPDVTFGLFGSTGYGMIRFEQDTRIDNEVLDVIIRSNSTLSEAKPVMADEEVTDASFGEFDQAQLFVNPGADEITVLDGVTPGEDDPATLYAALVAESTDAEIRERIATATATIDTSINRASEFTNRLVASGYDAPETPWFIEGDYVDDDGVYRPAQYLLGAHRVDYVDHMLQDGYINQVAYGLNDYDEYMTEHELRIDEASSLDTTPVEEVLRYETISRTDGSVLDLAKVTTGSSPTAQVSAKDSLESLRGVWQEHLSAKREIQQSLMLELLILDADVLSQPSFYSEATGEDTVYFY